MVDRDEAAQEREISNVVAVTWAPSAACRCQQFAAPFLFSFLPPFLSPGMQIGLTGPTNASTPYLALLSAATTYEVERNTTALC